MLKLENVSKMALLWTNLLIYVNHGVLMDFHPAIPLKMVEKAFDDTKSAMQEFVAAACEFENNMLLFRTEPEMASNYKLYLAAREKKMTQPRNIVSAEDIVKELCPQSKDLAPAVSDIVKVIFETFVGPPVTFCQVPYYTSHERESFVDNVIKDLCRPKAIREVFAVRHRHILAAVQLRKEYEPHIFNEL